MGAGILPIAIKDNQLYLLFGKENKYNDTPGWADFGGGIESSENILDAAIREGWEESSGFLGDPKEMKKKINKPNELEKFVVVKKYKLKKIEFNEINSTEINDFPMPSLDTIKMKITLGSYQIKMSKSYLAEHLKQNGKITKISQVSWLVSSISHSLISKWFIA